MLNAMISMVGGEWEWGIMIKTRETLHEPVMTVCREQLLQHFLPSVWIIPPLLLPSFLALLKSVLLEKMNG